MTGDSIPLPFKQVGAARGRLIFYFHGVPGAPAEMDAFDSVARQCDAEIICLDRFLADPCLQGDDYFRHLAAQIERIAGGRKMEWVGFSIGAFVAIKTVQYLAQRVTHLHLVSAAAPLDGADHLERAVGKHIFMLAQRYRYGFRLLASAQRVLARRLPSVMFRILFSNAAGADVALSQDPDFQSRMKTVLRDGFGKSRAGYVRDLHAYVGPWRPCLAGVATPTSIWHGEADNWSPISMADDLASSIPGCPAKQVLAGQSHYSCLYQAVPFILAAGVGALGRTSASQC